MKKKSKVPPSVRKFLAKQLVKARRAKKLKATERAKSRPPGSSR